MAKSSNETSVIKAAEAAAANIQRFLDLQNHPNATTKQVMQVKTKQVVVVSKPKFETEEVIGENAILAAQLASNNIKRFLEVQKAPGASSKQVMQIHNIPAIREEAIVSAEIAAQNIKKFLEIQKSTGASSKQVMQIQNEKK